MWSRRSRPRARLLPKALPTPPTYRETNPANSPVLIYAVHSDAYPIQELDQYSNILLGQSLSRVSGVGQVAIAGQAEPAVQVRLNPDALAAKGLGFAQVSAAAHLRKRAPTDGQSRGPSRRVSARRQPAAGKRRAVPQDDRILQQRRAGGARGHRDRSRRSAKPAHRRLVRDQAVRGSVGFQGARRQHARRGRQDQGDDASAREGDPALSARGPRLGPLALDSRIRLGRRIHPGAGDGAGRAGDLPVPAQVLGDRDSGHRPASRHRRDVRRRCICLVTASTTFR